MQIYIRRKNEDFGPFSRETVDEYVKQGVFVLEDRARISGMNDWKTLGDLIGEAKPAGARQNWPTAPRRGLRRRQQTSPAGEKKKTFMVVLNLTLLLLIAAAIYVRMGGAGEQAREEMAAIPSRLFGAFGPKSTPPPPEDLPQAPPPVAPPPAVATPAPPKPFDPATFAAHPGEWPKTVRLTADETFPAVLDSKVVGSVTVPAGTQVNVVSVQSGQLTVEYQGGTQKLPWKATDLETQARRNWSAAGN